MESKSFVLNPTNTNVIGLIEECINIFKFKASEKGIALLNSYDEYLPDIKIDGSRLKQIIINLLSNAIKYTEHGHVRITTETRDNSYIFISISDSGVGMSPTQLSQLFTNFTKFAANRHLNKEGVGLGLKIS